MLSDYIVAGSILVSVVAYKTKNIETIPLIEFIVIMI
jgi:hypothetical protein